MMLTHRIFTVSYKTVTNILNIPLKGSAFVQHVTINKFQEVLPLISSYRCLSSNGDKTNIDDVKRLLTSRETRVVVMAGAGLSTASGVPDFTTPGTGLYDNLQKYNLPYPEAVFELEYFRSKPEAFFRLATGLYPSGKLKPNAAHYFVRLLHDKGLLWRMYTQNIDGFERCIPEEKLVEAHGTFATATCMSCNRGYKGTDIEDSILKGEVARCVEPHCTGVVKPDIEFFGEQFPAKFDYPADFAHADLLLVMGTSLEVHPFASLVDAVRPDTPRVLFNMVAIPAFPGAQPRDLLVLGDLVKNLTDLCGSLGWTEDFDRLIQEMH